MRGHSLVIGERHAPGARALVLAGVATTLAAAVIGSVWAEQMPELEPVGFGQSARVSAAEHTSATIFVSTGLSRPPSCQVTDEDGDAVSTREAGTYRQGGGFESAFGFPVVSGSAYVVTCDSAAGTGRFAVAPDPAGHEGVFIAMGSLGVGVGAAGGILALRQRRRRHAGRDVTGDQPRP